MKDKLLYTTIGLLVLIFGHTSSANASAVRLSFYGYSITGVPTPVGCFDEFVDSVLVLDLDGTFGPEFQGSNYYFGYRSFGNQEYGCDLPDTQSDPGCSGYDITAWLEPFHLIIGHVNTIDQNAFLVGPRWAGYVPTDFTHIRIEFQAGHPCEQDARTFYLPISWVSQPVGVRSSTWGSIKALYR